MNTFGTNEKFPEFFIVGAPKCGTTALYSYLSSHPFVFMPKEKEPRFFCSDIEGINPTYDLQGYLSLFADAPAGTLIGEACTLNLFSRRAIPTILSMRPHAKIIVMMRNPIEMARALHAQMLLNLGEHIDDFEAAWRAQSERAKGNNLPWIYVPPLVQYGVFCSFSEQIKRLIDVVPEEQRFIIFYEEFFHEPLTYYIRLLTFLGLPYDGRKDFPTIFPGRTARRKKLQQFLRQPPFPINLMRAPLQILSHTLGMHLGAMAISLVGSKPLKKEQLRPEFERELHEYFRPDISALENLVGRRLDFWWGKGHRERLNPNSIVDRHEG